MVAGIVKQDPGLLFEGTNFTIVKKAGKAGDVVGNHNHPEANIIFTVVQGEVKVLLNQSEEHILTPGKVLNFDGDNHIQATFITDGAFVVNLMKK